MKIITYKCISKQIIIIFEVNLNIKIINYDKTRIFKPDERLN